MTAVAAATFGAIVKERRARLGITQAELGRRVGCAPITIRKIEADALRPSVQIAEHLAIALNIPAEAHDAFIRLARLEREPMPIPTPQPTRDEIGRENLSGRALRSFELGERIGLGGFGVVYRARQTTVTREVAIKIIHPHFADRPDFVRRFEAEAQIIAQLEHPFIVPLYDYWREPGAAYLVMRLMRGGSLRNLLEHGPLGHAAVLRLMEQICTALHSAHRAGVIHRDIKPANILLDDDRNAYLADFGIAKQLGADFEATQEGMMIGSPAYISPEQIRAEPVGPQSDIYSLGVMLYELLTGRQPFRAPTPIAYIQKHLNEPIPPLAAALGDTMLTALLASNPAVIDMQPIPQTDPTPLDEVIAKATAKRSEDRYPDMLSLLADIRRVLITEPHPTSSGKYQHTPFATLLVDLPDLENPYKGLRAFSEADAANFFGRDMLIQDLLARMSEIGDVARFLAVVGPSGSGKSSVVRAGLVPALRQGGLPGSENWFITDMLPGHNPFEELEVALLRAAVNPPTNLLAKLRANERGLLYAIRQILPTDPNIELVLVIDQFEEIFTLVADEPTRASFLNSLVTAILDPDSRLRVVVTLRADFLDQPLRYVDLGDLISQRSELVLPLTPDELEQAIVQPTERSGLTLERGLTQQIMREIGDQPGMLPLLQYALSELFERRQGRTLTRQAYAETGGVLGALARRADELYTKLDAPGQAAARQLMLRLVTPGDGTEDTRRRVVRSELATLDRSPLIDRIIDAFGRYRLLTFDNDPITRSPTVEVAHEAILRSWGRLRGWLDESRADIRQQRMLAGAATEWAASQRDSSFLLTGARLDQVAGWVTNSRVALTTAERAFLEASLELRTTQDTVEEGRRARELETAQKLATTEAQRASESVKSARRLRMLAIGLAILLLAAIGLTWFASAQRDTAQRNFEKAEQIRLAAQAQIALNNGEGGDLPALLALRSLKYGYSPEADAALLEALGRGFTKQVYEGHTDLLTLVAFSNDGRTILTASADKTARLWDAQSGKERQQLRGHTGGVMAATFTPDNQAVLTLSTDKTIRLWDVQTGQQIREYIGQTTNMLGLAITPDGREVAAGDGLVARLWDVQTGQEIRQFAGHTDMITWVDISPDGRSILTTSHDRTARLWDRATGAELRQFIGHTDRIQGGRFSPDGGYVATASLDKTARLWDVQSGVELRRFVGHTNAVIDIGFASDGHSMLTASTDKTARLWDIQSGQEIRQFIGHTAGVVGAVFAPNGRSVLTGSFDKTARLWDLSAVSEPQRLSTGLIEHETGARAVSVSADGKTVRSTTQNTIRIWDAQSGSTLNEIPIQTGSSNAQAFSYNQQFLLTAGTDNLVYLWDVQTGREIQRFAGHTNIVNALAFSHDDQQILTGGADRRARLWDPRLGQELQHFDSTSTILAVAFSPDNRTIATAGADQRIQLWDAQTGQAIRQFQGHTDNINTVAFSPDGRLLLSGSDDDTLRLWDSQSGKEVRRFIGHTGAILAAVFAPDGRSILSGSSDQTARLWEIESGRELRQFKGHVAAVRLIGFTPNGRTLYTWDTRTISLWHTTIADVVAFTCEQLAHDLTDLQRNLYQISDPTATCSQFAQRPPEPVWTPISSQSRSITPITLGQSNPALPSVIEMEFVNETANFTMNAGITEVYLDAGNETVKRTLTINPDLLRQPVYAAASNIPIDVEAPIDLGPFPIGKPLGFTLGEWVSAKGYGTYRVQSNRATIDMAFEHLVPHGLYTLWCVQLKPAHPNSMIEAPCGAPDGSENSFTADANGNAQKQMQIDAFPASTPDQYYEIGVAYHSDGQTHGATPGQHGFTVHGQLWFDFLPLGHSVAPKAQPPISMEFMNETANIAMGSPIEEVFIDLGNNQVGRATILNAQTLALPVFRAAIETLPDFEPPIELGPFPKGEALGFTLGDWVKARGTGTYTVQGQGATLEMTFDNLVPNGTYTVWCAAYYGTALNSAVELPCGNPDGSENSFKADQSGRAHVRITMTALPPSTVTAIQEIAIAYHSDGQTHGPMLGEHGHNAHVQLWFDFFPPGFVPPNAVPPTNP